MADPTQAEQDAEFAPADKIENFLAGFVAFISNFLRTLLDIAFRQTKFSRVITGREKGTQYTKPVTFISLITFLTIRIFRFGILTILLALSVPSCSVETWSKPNYPSILDELRIPSFTEFMLYGIPTLIVVLLIAQFLKFVLLKRQSASGKILVSTGYYLVGFQFVMYLFLFGVISLLVYFGSKLDWSPTYEKVFSVVLLIFVLCMLYVCFRVLLKTIDSDQLRVSIPVFRQLWLFLWTFILLAVVTFAAGGITYSLAKMEVDQRKPQRLLGIYFIDVDTTDANRISMNVWLRNNSLDDVVLVMTDIRAYYGKLVHHGQLTDSCMGHAAAILLASKQSCVLTLSFERLGEPYSPQTYGPPAEDVLEFRTIDGAGMEGTIYSYIYQNNQIFRLSGYQD